MKGLEIIPVAGDGACFYRSLAVAKGEGEDYFTKICQGIARYGYLLKNRFPNVRRKIHFKYQAYLHNRLNGRYLFSEMTDQPDEYREHFVKADLPAEVRETAPLEGSYDIYVDLLFKLANGDDPASQVQVMCWFQIKCMS